MNARPIGALSESYGMNVGTRLTKLQFNQTRRYLRASGLYNPLVLFFLLADGENAPPLWSGDESPPRNSRAATLCGIRGLRPCARWSALCLAKHHGSRLPNAPSALLRGMGQAACFTTSLPNRDRVRAYRRPVPRRRDRPVLYVFPRIARPEVCEVFLPPYDR